MGTAAATAGAAGPFRDYGPDGAAGRLSRSTPRQADDTTTRPSGSGPTRQSDVWDSEPDYLLCPTRHGPGMFTIPAKVFISDNQHMDVSRLEDPNQLALLSTQRHDVVGIFG